MDPAVAVTVALRDGGCLAPLVDPQAGPCYDTWGRLMPRTAMERCERDHWDWRGRGKNRAKATADQVAMLCPGHHRGAGPNGGRIWASRSKVLIEARVAAWIAAGRPRHFARKHLTPAAGEVT